MSVSALDELLKLGLRPSLVVTSPDKPQGRKLALTPNVVKTYAHKHSIPVFDPAKLDEAAAARLREEKADVFIVASYGLLIPKRMLDIPPRHLLNIHPSLLPLYRGASPLQTAMLDDAKHTGVSILILDEEMDHGPLAAQKEIAVSEWPAYDDFEDMMAREGARMIAEILPDWVSGKIIAREQDHPKATYTKKFSKQDAEIPSDFSSLSKDAQYEIFRKIQAFSASPVAFFFIEKAGKKLRVKVTKAHFKNGKLEVEKVVPEGGKEMTYQDFLSGYRK